MLSALMGAALAQNSNQTVATTATASSLEWDTKSIDVGKIQKDAPLELAFRFTNHSKDPVIIKNVRTSCGCTAAQHSQAPVLPGQSSEIKVSYDTRRIGFFNKTISVQTSDSGTPTILRITGTVE